MKAKKYTLSFAQANGYALGLIIPIFVVYFGSYGLIHGWETAGVDLAIFFSNFLIFLAALIIGTVAHEFIHAVCWWWLDEIAWSKIHFGFKWKTVTPYVHCPEPIEVNNYRWGVVMPGIILGFFPFLAALLLQNGWLFGFGLFFTLAAGGDFLILWLLRKVDDGSLVQDHPDLIGCKVLEPGGDFSNLTG